VSIFLSWLISQFVRVVYVIGFFYDVRRRASPV